MKPSDSGPKWSKVGGKFKMTNRLYSSLDETRGSGHFQERVDNKINTRHPDRTRLTRMVIDLRREFERRLSSAPAGDC